MNDREQEKSIATTELEKKLLSSLMLEEGLAIPAVSTILNADDFYRPEHRAIYQVLLNLYGKGTPLNVLLVENELRRTDDLKRVTRTYLFSLIDLEYTTARAEYYAKIIKEKSILRRLIEAGREIIDEADSERESVEKILEGAERKILSISASRNQTGFEALKEIMNRTFERINAKINRPNEIAGVTSGLMDLDRVLNGFQKSDLILLAARPSMGKTALALNIAANAARMDKSVGVFSLEMSKTQLGGRLLSTRSEVNSQYLNTGNVGNEEMNALINALNELSNLKMYIDDTAGLGLLELRSKARRLKHERGLDLMIIDYLQLMQGGRAENRQQEISEISRGLKGLARELDIPIIALSQLSRSVELRAEKKPQLSDLRESGSLEQDADIVMFLYREEYYNREADNENIAELIIAKNRNGPTTSIRLQFNKEIMRFGDLTRAEY
ncbi:MAG: replicative DNA helicase [Selenomonadaceae bacterium]|nr:replicative DNA helicase [Selenomonadaceae bacterium]MBQ3726531.1 replicative DNA helicase [Selenomonadaceae bacterium]